MTTIGIVGGGQLGKMMTQEAKKMGFAVIVLDPTPGSPAGQIADRQIVADFKDEKAIKKLAREVDILTFEIELANSQVLEDLQKAGVTVHPSPRTLAIIKDKLAQKRFLQKSSLPVAPFQEVESTADIYNALKKWGYPLVLKARFDAYDGRGNALIKNSKDIQPALEKLKNRPLYLEKYAPFAKELALMVARNTRGEISVFPLVETIHKNNICHIVKVPAPVSQKVTRLAQDLAQKTVTHLKGAGVFGIEMFYCPLPKKRHRDSYPEHAEGPAEILINEIAPRVHNSGHYSIEASYTSQFEQHLRAITNLPLGNPNLKVPAAVMINILGKIGRAHV